MSRLQALARRVTQLPTIARTVARLRPGQAVAQVAHLVRGNASPERLEAGAPRLALASIPVGFCSPPEHVEVGAPGGGVDDAGARALTLLRLSLSVDAGCVPWTTDRHGPLFAYHLHEQAWLRHASLGATERAAFIADWIAAHPQGIGWDPHPISLRLLSWGKLLLTEGALEIEDPARAEMLASMADQAETLAAGLEVRLQANHLLSNLIGVVWAGLLFEGARADSWRAHADRLRGELAQQIRRDGGHEERSPMYHALLLENLLDLLQLAQVSPRTPDGFVAFLADTTRRMASALALWTGPDGRIALFADAAWSVAQSPAVLFAYAERLGVVDAPPEVASLRFEDSDYARIEAGAFVCLQSVGPPSPAHQPGHAHGDGLAFECWVGGSRLVSDTGVFEYRPGARRDRARATASHATLVFDGAEQSEFWSAHRVGGRARQIALETRPGEVHAAMQGYRRGAPIHERTMRVTAEAIEIEDAAHAAGRRVESRLPLAPEWAVSLEGDVALARHTESGECVRIRLGGDLGWTLERAPFFPTFHAEVERSVLVGRGMTPFASRIRIERG